MDMQKILTLGIVNDLAANINLFYLKMLQISIYRIIAVHQKLFTRVEKKIRPKPSLELQPLLPQLRT